MPKLSFFLPTTYCIMPVSIVLSFLKAALVPGFLLNLSLPYHRNFTNDAIHWRLWSHRGTCSQEQSWGRIETSVTDLIRLELLTDQRQCISWDFHLQSCRATLKDQATFTLWNMTNKYSTCLHQDKYSTLPPVPQVQVYKSPTFSPHNHSDIIIVLRPLITKLLTNAKYFKTKTFCSFNQFWHKLTGLLLTIFEVFGLTWPCYPIHQVWLKHTGLLIVFVYMWCDQAEWVICRAISNLRFMIQLVEQL